MRGWVGESATRYASGTTRGMMLVKELSNKIDGRILLLPDYLEGSLGPVFTSAIEQGRDLLKDYDFFVDPYLQHDEREAQKSGDTTWGKTTERLDDLEFEKRFRVYSDGEPDLHQALTLEHRNNLTDLVNELKLPISIAYSGSRMYVFINQGPFFDFSSSDLFDDLSHPDAYERYYDDLVMAQKAVDLLSFI